ncbi:MAG: hypothetical protein V1848_02115 [Candidatus Magasanikbacteria bacterium]
MNIIQFLRQYRISDYAIFDLAVTFLGIYLLAPVLTKIFLKINIKISKKSWLFFALPLGIIVHLLVGRMTPMTQNFLDLQSHYVLKICIILLVILGAKDIKRVKK